MPLVKQLVLFYICALALSDHSLALDVLGPALKLYAWGNNVTGMQIYYDHAAPGVAVLTDEATAISSQNLVPVLFNPTQRQHPPPGFEKGGYSFTATPDLSAIDAAAAEQRMPKNATFFVGDNQTSHSDPTATHEVGFLPGAEDPSTPIPPGVKLGAFILPMPRLFVMVDEGPARKLNQAWFCAFPSKENPKIWAVKYNVSNNAPERAEGVPVTLRLTRYPENTPPRDYMEKRCRVWA